MSMTNVATAQKVTIKDVAAKAGVSWSTASNCLGKYNAHYSSNTVAKVKAAAEAVGYGKPTLKIVPDQKVDKRRTRPANSIFASKDAETAAMEQLRKAGNSDRQIAKQCGVCVATVTRRIGHQSKEMTKAHVKLAGVHKRAENKIKKMFAAQTTVSNYNVVAAKLNAKLVEAQKLAVELEKQQQAAVEASKTANVPLLRLLEFPKTIAQ